MMRAALLAALAATLLAGCGLGVDLRPRPAADAAARESIAAAGGDPGEWVVGNSCGSSGTCGVELSPRCDPAAVVAINRYRIKDSFPTLLGDDRIGRAAARGAPCRKR